MTRVALIGLACACFVSFVWAVKGHFRNERDLPLGMRLVSLGSVAGFLWWTWDEARAPAVMPHGAGLAFAAGLALLAGAAALFWWAVLSGSASTLPVAFSDLASATVRTGGPFRYLRHPFYAAYIAFWVATALLCANPWHWLFTVSLAGLYVALARREEAFLLRSPLADRYAEYRARTGMFVPLPTR